MQRSRRGVPRGVAERDIRRCRVCGEPCLYFVLIGTDYFNLPRQKCVMVGKATAKTQYRCERHAE